MFGKISAVVASLALVSAANAALVFDTSYEFSGGTAPSGPAPWVRTTISDAGANTVTIKIENLNLVGTEFNRQLSLNLDPALDPTLLNFSSPVQVGTFNLPTISTGVNAFKADGDGFFDVLFEFATPNPQRFGPGEAVTYTVTGITGLDESDFNFISVNGPVGNNGWPVAAHVQGIGTGGNFSGWVTVPEPALGALALIAIPLMRRRA